MSSVRGPSALKQTKYKGEGEWRGEEVGFQLCQTTDELCLHTKAVCMSAVVVPVAYRWSVT